MSIFSVLRLLILASLIALAPGARASGDDTTRQTLDSARVVLADVETALKSDNLTEADLERLRSENDPLVVQLQALLAQLGPRLEASSKRLSELTPKSKDALAEVASAELNGERQKHDALDADVRSARAMLLQIDDDNARISAERRDLFARQTFARSSSVLSPLLWIEVARETPSDIADIGGLLSGWLRGVKARVSAGQAFGLLAVALAIAALGAPVQWVTRRVIARDPDVVEPSRLRRALAAAWTIVVLAVLPLLAMEAFVYALDAFDISDPQVQGTLDALLDGLRVIIVSNALGRGLLAPGQPNWRLIALPDRIAGLLFNLWLAVATIVAAERLLEPAADAVASLNIAVAGRALGSALVAILIARTLRRIFATLQTAKVGAAQPYEAVAPVRMLLWVLVGLILGSALAGYIAFATFLVNQTLFVATIATMLYVIDIIVQEGAELLLRPKAPLGRGLMTMIGVRRDALEQVIALVQAFARLAIVVSAIALLLGPWSLSQDLSSTIRAAYFGVRIGGITLSVSSLLGAAVVLGVIMAATRGVQNWLGSRFLPHTRLDAGVRNSVRTIVGYVGVLSAVMMSCAQLGLGFERLAIVAGALSVGIGFGLQSIVNNFVSGLILLWERGIRVGDWVVVGADQGFVRRINARATEIETFDRGTLIVPNATLVSGAVKNWMHADRTGRIVLALNVAYESDPEVVRELLIAAAKSQDPVLSIPAPHVLFSEFGDWALRFQLICFVDDVVMAERVRSEMNFDIFRRMREAGLRVPYPK